MNSYLGVAGYPAKLAEDDTGRLRQQANHEWGEKQVIGVVGASASIK